MFQVNDVIMYGKHGVCKVTEVGTLSMGSADKDKKYYTLHLIYQNDAVVYVPVDNDKIVMRTIISKEEAENLISDIPNMESIWIANERERENQYKAALKTCDCKELIKMIKTIYQRKLSRMQDGKKATTVDEKYFHMAEDKLYGELAFVLNIDKENVQGYITERIEV